MRYRTDHSSTSAPGLRARRRQVLRFLAGFGLAAPSGALVTAIDAALGNAAAQPAAGQPVPRLGVYLPNWPDMVELWRQLARDWQAIGVELDLQQGTLDTFVAQIVSEQKLPHMGSMSWGGAPDRLDPDYFLSEMFHSRRTARGGLNFGFYRNAEFDRLAEKRAAEKEALRLQHEAVRADERRIKSEREEARQTATRETEEAVEAEKRAARKERKQLTKEEQKAARDARYAARKARTPGVITAAIPFSCAASTAPRGRFGSKIIGR